MKKTEGKLQFFIFWKIVIFLEFVFHFFSFVYHFSSFFINSTTGSKNDEKMIKKMKKTRGKLHFFIFRKIFGALEAKMVKNDKKMKKKKKKEKKMKKLRENCNFSFFGKL